MCRQFFSLITLKQTIFSSPLQLANNFLRKRYQPPSSLSPHKTIMYQSIPSLTIPLPTTPGDSHILVAPGVGFSLLSFARGLPRGVLNQSKSSTILKKARFSLCLLTLNRAGGGAESAHRLVLPSAVLKR